MDEVFEYIHSCNRKDLGEFFRLKMEMETRQDKNDEKQKENEKDIINNINDAIFVVWLKND